MLIQENITLLELTTVSILHHCYLNYYKKSPKTISKGVLKLVCLDMTRFRLSS